MSLGYRQKHCLLQGHTYGSNDVIQNGRRYLANSQVLIASPFHFSEVSQAKGICYEQNNCTQTGTVPGITTSVTMDVCCGSETNPYLRSWLPLTGPNVGECQNCQEQVVINNPYGKLAGWKVVIETTWRNDERYCYKMALKRRMA